MDWFCKSFHNIMEVKDLYVWRFLMVIGLQNIKTFPDNVIYHLLTSLLFIFCFMLNQLILSLLISLPMAYIIPPIPAGRTTNYPIYVAIFLVTESLALYISFKLFKSHTRDIREQKRHFEIMREMTETTLNAQKPAIGSK